MHSSPRHRGPLAGALAARVLLILSLACQLLSSPAVAETRVVQRGIWESTELTSSTIECGNLSSKDESLTIVFHDQSGAELARTVITLRSLASEMINPKQHLAAEGRGFFELHGTCEAASIRCHTVVYEHAAPVEGPVVPTVPPALERAYAMPALHLVTQSRSGIISPLLAGKTQRNGLVVLNPGSAKLALRLRIFGEGEAEPRSTDRIELAARELREIELLTGNSDTPYLFEVVPYDRNAEFAVIQTRGFNESPHRYAIDLKTQLCDTGPAALVLTPRSANQIELANPSETARNVSVSFHSSAGDRVAILDVDLPARAVRYVPLPAATSEQPPAGSVRFRCNSQEPLLVNVVSYGFEREAAEPSWVFATQPLAPPAETKHQVALFVNSWGTSANLARYLEWSEVLTECDINIHEGGGEVVAANTLSLRPACRARIVLHEQTGSNFHGLAIATTDTIGAAYSAELLRTHYAPDGRVIAVLAIPGAVTPRHGPFEELLLKDDPEVLQCMGTVQAPSPHRTSFIDEDSRKKSAETAYSLASRGYALSQQGNLAAALEMYRSAVKEYPKFLCARLHIVNLNYRMGNFVAASTEAQEVLELDPRNASAHGTLGNIAVKAGRFDIAEGHYRQALALDSHSAQRLHALAFVAYKRGNYAEALRLSEQGISLEPRHLLNNEIAARAAQYLELPEKARTFYLAMIDIIQRSPPDSLADEYDLTPAGLVALLGEAYAAVGKTTEAIESLRQSLQMEQIAATHARLGDVYRTAARPKEAEESYRAALLLDDQDSWAKLGLGKALRDQGRHEQALSILKSIYSDDRYGMSARREAAWSLLEASRDNEALAEFQEVLALNPNDEWAHSNVGWIHERAKRYDLALESYQRALTLNPDKAKNHSSVGMALQLLDRFEEAMPFLNRAVELEPHNNDYLNNLGWVELRRGNYHQAIFIFEQVLARDPDHGYANPNLDEALRKLREVSGESTPF